MSNKTEVTVNGIGFVGLLQIVFIVLKLCKVITWTWLWVLSPIWMYAALITGIFIIGLIIVGIQELLD